MRRVYWKPAILTFALIAFRPGCASAQAIAQADASFLRVHKAELPSNATSCAECHAVPGPGGSSRMTVTRAGRTLHGRYMGIGLGGTLHTHGEAAIDIVGLITGHRVALNILGDGFVEAVPGEELRAIAAGQIERTHGRVHGEPMLVTLPESRSRSQTIGRFGWKAQHASLLSASADALRTELGIPNPFFPATPELSSAFSAQTGSTVLGELEAMVGFLRSTEPIAPDAERSATQSAQAGSRIFDRIGCSVCHMRTLRTASAGTRVDGGTWVVPDQLGNKEIHPFSDYLLHDVGTGDGIVQSICPQDYSGDTANKFRTAPLWGVRYRSWLMHDGRSITYHQAIMHHAGEASDSVRQYMQLTPVEKEQLRLFLNSL